MITIREVQYRALAYDYEHRLIADLARSIRFDFKEELADADPISFEQLVRRLVRYIRSFGFTEYPHVYRLVSWGVFFGESYLSDFGDGSLAEIARAPGFEEERFARICETILRPGFPAERLSAK